MKRTPNLLTFGNEENNLFVADHSGYLSLFKFDTDSAELHSDMKFDQGISHLLADGPDLCVVGKFL